MVLKTNFKRSDENSQDPLNENFKEIGKYIEDTGWIPLPLTSDFKAYGDNPSAAPAYRRIGKLVEIRGGMQPTKVIASGAMVVVGVLPEGFYPTGQPAYQVNQGSLKNTWTSIVDVNGDFRFTRYGTTSNAETPVNAWLPFTIHFFVD